MNVTRIGLVSLMLVALAAFAAACGAGTTSTGSATPTAGAAVSGPTAGAGEPPKGAAAAKAPLERANMYPAAPPMTIDPNKTYRATIKTNKGDIVVDLFPQDAPQHVNNFVFLAREGFYDGLTFHRVEKDPSPFVIQGGDPLGRGNGGPGYTIPPEIKRTHPRGALAMARTSGPPETTPSSGSQFYITLDAVPFLDGAYTSFGQTTDETMAVADQIAVGDVIQSIVIEEQ